MNAQKRFWRMFRIVAGEPDRSLDILKLFLTRTTSAVSRATSVAEPTAMPTVALARKEHR